MRFVPFSEVAERFRGRSVAIVGSAPSVLDNRQGFIDSHDVVVRVNNYKLGHFQGDRTDVHYSFYGSSIRNRVEDLKQDGVTLCMCKCPDAKPIESPWHEAKGRQRGIDFRPIYVARRDWWFCDVYVPTVENFMKPFEALGRHIPTSGFAAIWEILACEPRYVYLTGFDFFRSGKHNVDENWKEGDSADPIRHLPELEAKWLADNASRLPLQFDRKLTAILGLA